MYIYVFMLKKVYIFFKKVDIIVKQCYNIVVVKNKLIAG